MAYLKKLQFSRFKKWIKNNNIDTCKNINTAWKCIWAEKINYSEEKDFTEIFILHVDAAIKNEVYDLASALTWKPTEMAF